MKTLKKVVLLNISLLEKKCVFAQNYHFEDASAFSSIRQNFKFYKAETKIGMISR